jgi:hypothetical protein
MEDWKCFAKDFWMEVSQYGAKMMPLRPWGVQMWPLPRSSTQESVKRAMFEAQAVEESFDPTHGLL